MTTTPSSQRTGDAESGDNQAAGTQRGSDRGQQLLNKREVARFLQVSVRTVEEYQRRGLPFYRLGPRRNRYDLVVVLDWLNSKCRVVRDQ